MPRIINREGTWRNLVASNLEPYKPRKAVKMGLYILGILQLCKRWWFAILMSIVLWYFIYVFFSGLDTFTKTMKTYFNNLGI